MTDRQTPCTICGSYQEECSCYDYELIVKALGLDKEVDWRDEQAATRATIDYGLSTLWQSYRETGYKHG